MSWIGNHLFRYRRSMDTMLISNGLRKRKSYQRPLRKDSLQKVLQECGGYIDGSWHDSHWYWEIFGDTEDRNDISGQWYDEWPLDRRVDSPNFWSLRDTFPPTLVNARAEYLEADEDDALNDVLLCDSERKKTVLPCTHPPYKAVLFGPLPGQVHHLTWWLTKCFADHLDIFYMYAEMDNNCSTETLLKFQDWQNLSVFVTTPKVGGTGLNLAATNYAEMTPTFLGLNMQQPAFGRVVWLWQNWVSHTWLLNTGPGGYDNKVSDLHQLPAVTSMRVLHGQMSWPNITTSMMYHILGCRENHQQQLMELGDLVPTDGEDEWLLLWQCNQHMCLQTFNQ